MMEQVETKKDNLKKDLVKRCGDYLVTLYLDQYQQKLNILLQNCINKNKYSHDFQQGKLSEDLKAYLVDLQYIYEYFQENLQNKEKIVIDNNGKIILTFLLQISSKKQVKKQIIIETQLKQVGKAQIQDNSEAMSSQIEKVKKELQQYKKQQQQQRKKSNQIIRNLQKTNQRIIVESQTLKFENLNLKNKVNQIFQKYEIMENKMNQVIMATSQIKLQNSSMKKQMQQSKILSVEELKQDDFFIKKVGSFIKQNDNGMHSEIIQSKIKSLQIQVLQQNKILEEKLQISEKNFAIKFQDLKKQHKINIQQLYKQMEQINNKLEDSQIQLIKNTVKKVNSMIQNGEQLKSSNKSYIQKIAKSSINVNGHRAKIGTSGKFYCGGKLQGKKCRCCDGNCGPTNGQNCLKCMKLDIQRRGLKKGFLINANGQISWQQKGRMRCGIGNGKSNCGQNDQYCYFCERLSDSVKDRYAELL